LTIVDNRTGKQYEIPIKNNTIKAEALSVIRAPKKGGLRSYDPGYLNTSSATSRICYINEVSFLLLYGELPSTDQLQYFSSRILRHTYIHEDLKDMMKSFRYDAHPMGMLISSIAAMSTFHPEANPALEGGGVYANKRNRNKQIHRILGTVPTIAAFAYRHRIGRPYIDPAAGDLGYTENFLFMLDKLSHKDYKPHPTLVKALEVLFILHADHELNCSTAAMRHLASSGVDVYTCIAGAASALYGPLHGGANEAVLRMLEKIKTIDNIPKFIEGVKNKKEKLMGFGHRVYKNYDPRARIVKAVADEVFAILGKEPLIEIAIKLEQIALSDKYFIERKLYPNVDFYSGVIYKAMGFPTDYFPVLFAIPRTVGWLAHWNEFLDDPENKIIRPRQVYRGPKARPFVALKDRSDNDKAKVETLGLASTEARRREAGDESAKEPHSTIDKK